MNERRYNHCYAGIRSVEIAFEIHFWPDVTLRDTVSNHAPVWIALGDTNLELTAFDDRAFEPVNNEVYCIDLNEATADQLSELPNVGPIRSGQIIEMRPWGRIEELTRVSGLGTASVKAIVASELVCS